MLKDYLLNAVENMIRQFDIDGLRLDAADCIDIDFLKVLSTHCKSIKKDFWLMGEIIHGDYNKWANNETLDSTTNYECYKGLYSSHNDNNYFELAYSLNRQFGKNGIYKNLFLYNFADNHDVDRIASILTDKAHLYPLHILLFTIPGIPSIYYGSEYGIEGRRTSSSDMALRPELSLENCLSIAKHKDLNDSIKKLASIRQSNDALIYGDYEEILVSHKHFVFKRKLDNTTIVVAVNSNNKEIEIELLDKFKGNKLIDILNSNETIVSCGGKFRINLYKNWGRIMVLQ
jgi:glycosidase